MFFEYLSITAKARAAYSEADVVVIDNVFAALDADTIHTIFSSCIAKLMRHATRIIAVSDLALFKHFERLVVLREGEVIAEGPLDVLTARGIPEVIHPSDDIEEDALVSTKRQSLKREPTNMHMCWQYMLALRKIDCRRDEFSLHVTTMVHAS